MLNVLAALEFDLDGYVEIQASASPDRDQTRRVNRVLTLDGGVASNDGGWSVGDLTFEIEWKSNRSTDAAVERLLRLYSRVCLMNRSGAFEVILEKCRLDNNGVSTVSCLPVSQLSA